MAHPAVAAPPAAVVAEAVAVAAEVKPDARFKSGDRVGLGWRSEIAAHIFTHLEHIDVLEVIADNYFSATKKSLQSLKFLASERPVFLHGVSMGLASSHATPAAQIQKMARLVDKIQPAGWSEHLAFVRAGGIEIGHLAAPPRNTETVNSTLKNIALAKQLVGSLPQLENIATLIAPPASSMTESEWLNCIIKKSGANLLLDLHNLYANALNFGLEPLTLLLQLPLDKICSIHLSGGCFIATPDGKGQRLLDDHIHDVPGEVFDLLVELSKRAPQPLTVLIERDGNFPAFESLLGQIAQARKALQIGRQLALAEA